MCACMRASDVSDRVCGCGFLHFLEAIPPMQRAASTAGLRTHPTSADVARRAEQGLQLHALPKPLIICEP